MTKKLFLSVLILGLLSLILERNGFTAGAQVVKIDETETLTTTLTNPCDPSGESDVTASVTEHFTGSEITLPDGTKNGIVNISLEGEGTDSQDNTYVITGTATLHENHDVVVGTIGTIKVTSDTGGSFNAIVQSLDLNNNSVDHEKLFCLGN